jgi:hypothetical protein
VAKDNLGTGPRLMAAPALLIDHVLTVAVSISAGVGAITSAYPVLGSLVLPIGRRVRGVVDPGKPARRPRNEVAQGDRFERPDPAQPRRGDPLGAEKPE